MLAATWRRSATVPVASIALILGIDRFMSEARALTNLVGNGVATVVVAKWEDALDEERLHRRLNQETEAEADDPEAVLDEVDVAAAAPAAALSLSHATAGTGTPAVTARSAGITASSSSAAAPAASNSPPGSATRWASAARRRSR